MPAPTLTSHKPSTKAHRVVELMLAGESLRQVQDRGFCSPEYAYAVAESHGLVRKRVCKVPRNKILEMLRTGMDRYDVVVETGASLWWVDVTANAAGLHERKCMTPDQIKRMRSLRDEHGMTYKAIAARFGCSDANVRYHLLDPERKKSWSKCKKVAWKDSFRKKLGDEARREHLALMEKSNGKTTQLQHPTDVE